MGDVVGIEVSDSGPGFSVQDRLHAFTPYYSGRSAGRHLGLGLPIVKRLLDDMSGSITIGFGTPTLITVFIPAAR